MVFKNVCVLVLWPKVALALEGLILPVKYCSYVLTGTAISRIYHCTKWITVSTSIGFRDGGWGGGMGYGEKEGRGTGVLSNHLTAVSHL